MGSRADRPAAVYAVLGVWAPVLLVGLRVLQGFSAGGRMGRRGLMAVEQRAGAPLAVRRLSADRRAHGHDRRHRRLWCLTTAIGMERFMDWGWRVPFLLSVLL